MAVDDIKTGVKCKVEIVPELPATPIVLPNSSWTITRISNPVDVMNTRDGRSRRPGLADYEGSVEGPYDSTVDPIQVIDDESIMTLRLYVDDTHFYELRAIFDNIEIDTQGLEDLVQWSFDYSLASGVLTPPTP